MVGVKKDSFTLFTTMLEVKQFPMCILFWHSFQVAKQWHHKNKSVSVTVTVLEQH